METKVIKTFVDYMSKNWYSLLIPYVDYSYKIWDFTDDVFSLCINGFGDYCSNVIICVEVDVAKDIVQHVVNFGSFRYYIRGFERHAGVTNQGTIFTYPLTELVNKVGIEELPYIVIHRAIFEICHEGCFFVREVLTEHRLRPRLVKLWTQNREEALKLLQHIFPTSKLWKYISNVESISCEEVLEKMKNMFIKSAKTMYKPQFKNIVEIIMYETIYSLK